MDVQLENQLKVLLTQKLQGFMTAKGLSASALNEENREPSNVAQAEEIPDSDTAPPSACLTVDSSVSSSTTEEGEISDLGLEDGELLSLSEPEGPVIKPAALPCREDDKLLVSLIQQQRSLAEKIQLNDQLLMEARDQHQILVSKIDSVLEMIDKCQNIREQFIDRMEELDTQVAERRFHLKSALAAVAYDSEVTARPKAEENRDHEYFVSFIRSMLNEHVQRPQVDYSEVVEGIPFAGSICDASMRFMLNEFDTALRCSPSVRFFEHLPLLYPNGGYLSASLTCNVNPMQPICTEELVTGKCDLGRLCKLQHLDRALRAHNRGDLEMAALRDMMLCLFSCSRKPEYMRQKALLALFHSELEALSAMQAASFQEMASMIVRIRRTIE